MTNDLSLSTLAFSSWLKIWFACEANCFALENSAIFLLERWIQLIDENDHLVQSVPSLPQVPKMATVFLLVFCEL